MKHNPMYAATQEDTDVISPSKEHEPGAEVHSERKEGIGTRRVRFEQSISTESHGSWHESFQTSLEANNRQVNHGDVNEIGSFNKYENLGKYHTLEKEKKGAFKDGTDILISSGRDGNPIIRAMFGIISGLLTGAIFVVILRFTFDYTYFQAGIITVVYTVIVCIGLALSSICRCIMAVLVPNFFTGKGRVIILSIIFGVMLSGPIANISHNFKESGNSLACSIDLINTQLQVLQRKLEEPVKDMALYVNKQKEECQKPIEDFFSKCRPSCNQFEKALNDSLKLFSADVDMKVFSKGGANSSKTSKKIQVEINKEVDEKVNVLRTISFVTTKVLSVSLFIIFIQSFLYIKSYLAKDGCDNVYVTKDFRSFDEEQGRLGQTSLLPLKKCERTKYVDTKSWKLNSFELNNCTTGLAQVFLHFIFCVTVVLFDYVLFYILNLVRIHGSLELGIQSNGTITIVVHGNGPVADFYRVIFQGLDNNEGFSSNLHFSRCLPSPNIPYALNIPVFLALYLVAIGVVCLRGYGMRLRRKISAYYYPEQENARIAFLHKTIQNSRAGVQRFLRQHVRSTHKECTIKDQLRFSKWLRSKCQCLEKVLPNRNQRKCTSCGQTDNESGSSLKNCTEEKAGETCKAMYCVDCNAALAGECPLCCDNDVALKE
ncbi:hypothetical protein DPMN_081452 [Dreissena polymorpha]|uniref:Dendritic cell-specific transmembrane protein-like domain-containing protein n=1 Tax=Dreissena polymorpha TaxID=45954 RepID=A0A9D4BHS7_DREPO|nr:hypothetical protein DPMN_081452 [Dreissena polymorpha]